MRASLLSAFLIKNYDHQNITVTPINPCAKHAEKASGNLPLQRYEQIEINDQVIFAAPPPSKPDCRKLRAQTGNNLAVPDCENVGAKLTIQASNSKQPSIS